jgi:hypothetical protein
MPWLTNTGAMSANRFLCSTPLDVDANQNTGLRMAFIGVGMSLLLCLYFHTPLLAHATSDWAFHRGEGTEQDPRKQSEGLAVTHGQYLTKYP